MNENQSLVMGRIIVDGKTIRLLYAGTGSRRYFIRHEDGKEEGNFDSLCQAFAFMQRTWGQDIIGSAIDWNKPIKTRPIGEN